MLQVMPESLDVQPRMDLAAAITDLRAAAARASGCGFRSALKRQKPRRALSDGPAGLLATLHAYFFTGVVAGAEGAAAGVAAVLEVPVFFTAGLVECFLVCFFTLAVEAAGVPLPLAGGVAGVCAANVRGMVAKARAMVIKVVFIFVFSCGLCRPLTIPSCG